MSREPGNTRINGTALELIMRDVLQGMRQFTEDACSGCSAAGMEINAVEAAGTTGVNAQGNVIQLAKHRKSA
jgi:hypothetical protein